MLPLQGIVVIAVEQAVAAPFCSSRLADAGAHVIKIERPEGDFARGYDAAAKGQSSYFVWLNRGKDSVVIDLATKEGRQSLEELIASADVLLQNLKPGSMDKLGFSLERLRKDYPSLITCTISGYGDDGPYAHRKAYDLLIQAESGLCSITGGPEGASRVGMSIVDVATGATAHASILEALIGRGRTGKGVDIRISMFDVMADWCTVPLLNAEDGKPPQRMGLAHPSVAPYGVFRSKDGKDVLFASEAERAGFVPQLDVSHQMYNNIWPSQRAPYMSESYLENKRNNARLLRDKGLTPRHRMYEVRGISHSGGETLPEGRRGEIQILDMSRLIDGLVDIFDAWIEKGVAPPPLRSDWAELGDADKDGTIENPGLAFPEVACPLGVYYPYPNSTAATTAFAAFSGRGLEPLDANKVFVDMNRNGYWDYRETPTQAWRRLGLLGKADTLSRERYAACVEAAAEALRKDGFFSEKTARGYAERAKTEELAPRP